MNEPTGSTTQLELWLALHKAGDPSAKNEIIARSCERLRLLARRMLRRDYPRIARWDQTDDVLQMAIMRLNRSLMVVQPDSIAGFLRLAAKQMRFALLDLVGRHFGPEGHAAHHDTGHYATGDEPIKTAISEDGEPVSLEDWTAFHKAVELLPSDEREAISLVFYEGLTQTEAAKLLGVTERTVRRRLTSAKLQLGNRLGDRPPE